MKKENLKILFMGTPDFAVKSLKTLIEGGYNIVGVVTAPDKPSGRGYKINQSPVKQYALKQGLNLLQPEKLKDEKFTEQLRELNIDLQIVVAFRMLPEIVWAMPRLGTFNLHASLLPQYRGAAPINWAIINGETETGVTTFLLSHEIDVGEILFREKVAIYEDDNAGTLHDRLMVKGARLVQKTVDAIIDGTATAQPQSLLYSDEAELKAAPKIFTDGCRIDWGKSSNEIYNFIRGLSPYPTAWTELYREESNESIRLKIFSSEIVKWQKDSDIIKRERGKIDSDNKKHIDVVLNDAILRITDLQISGKRRMSSEQLLNGFSFQEKDRFR